MRVIIRILLFITILFNISCRDKYQGEPLTIQNNSNQRVYYWLSYWRTTDFPKYHYPDTILPSEKPISINSIALKNATGYGESDPNWTEVFSKLPEGKLTIYFFPESPATQEDWNLIRQTYDLVRKDITYSELKSNNFRILYP